MKNLFSLQAVLLVKNIEQIDKKSVFSHLSALLVTNKAHKVNKLPSPLHLSNNSQALNRLHPALNRFLLPPPQPLPALQNKEFQVKRTTNLPHLNNNSQALNRLHPTLSRFLPPPLQPLPPLQNKACQVKRATNLLHPSNNSQAPNRLHPTLSRFLPPPPQPLPPLQNKEFKAKRTTNLPHLNNNNNQKVHNKFHPVLLLLQVMLKLLVNVKLVRSISPEMMLKSKLIQTLKLK